PADRGHGALFLAARRLRLPEALERDRRLARRRAHARPHRRDAGARRRVAGARQICGHEGGEAAMSTVDKVIRPEILAMHAYPVADASGLVKLDLMESPYGLPPELAAEIGKIVSQLSLNRYPVPSAQKLRAL